MRIRKAQVTDSGIYSCEVNTNPVKSVSRVLTVDYPDAINVLYNQTKHFADSVDHNFTQCCEHEGVSQLCFDYCHFKGLVSGTPKPQIAAVCVNHMSSITKCLADGKNHIPCCKRQQVPSVCLGSCVGKYTLTTAFQHAVCLDYAGPILACIAQGVEILPHQPKDVIAEEISEFKVGKLLDL